MTGPEAAAALAAGLAMVATGLAVPGRPSRLPPPRTRPDGPPPRGDGDLLEQHRLAVVAVAAAAPVLLLGGVLGAAGGAVVALAVHRTLRRREPAPLRRRREETLRRLPHVVDLLAVVLTAGASPSGALATVAEAVEDPVASELRAARRALDLGRDPVRVWREVSERPGLAALGRSMARAVETGASVSDALHRLAEDLHATAGQEAESRARRVAVQAAAPLGLCLLPAFVLVGVVPLVAGTVASLLVP